MTDKVKYRTVTFVISEEVVSFDGDDRTEQDIINEAWYNVVDNAGYSNTPEGCRINVSDVLEREDKEDD